MPPPPPAKILHVHPLLNSLGPLKVTNNKTKEAMNRKQCVNYIFLFTVLLMLWHPGPHLQDYLKKLFLSRLYYSQRWQTTPLKACLSSNTSKLSLNFVPKMKTIADRIKSVEKVYKRQLVNKRGPFKYSKPANPEPIAAFRIQLSCFTSQSLRLACFLCFNLF